MSRLHAFGQLSPEDRQEYIMNMNMSVSNQRIKGKVDKMCGRRVRPEVSFRDRVRNFLKLDETMKNEEKLDVAPDGKLTKLAKKQPKKKPVPEPFVEPEPTTVKGSGMTTKLLQDVAVPVAEQKPKKKYTRKPKKEETK
jgi:hypothetical protein